ncbi:protein of unknown function [Papillibacter cinnamivorans DSM 12816]|uniref:DUF5104 domain-containing protein n=1 Tax=Papillibacter cinnamivorans DSM 12816 TaxID=1122930 RepID=A0A1W2A568_9FIRM|nr:protein of unknown function [Papillibacter cinnamivorans DSM 12816]
MRSYGIIKRFGAFLCASAMLMLCSCTRLGAPIVYNNDGEKADARLEEVIETIKNEDKEALEAMFSEQALSEAEDLDGRMDYLFGFIQGNAISWKAIVAGPAAETNIRGHIVKKSKSWYSVKTDKEEYLFFLLEYTEDTDHPENVGIYMLQVIYMKDEDTQFDGGNDILCAGIYKPEEENNETVQPSGDIEKSEGEEEIVQPS